MNRRLLLRVLALVVLAWVVWDGASRARRQGARVRDLDERVRVLEARLELQAERRRTQLVLPGPEAFESKAHRDAQVRRRLTPGARARQSTEGMPGATLLNRLYDAADELAVEESWDAHTYDEVSRVFERTVSEVARLFEEVQDGRTTAADARRTALRVRDAAQQDLVGILGVDGVERLKRVMGDDLP